MKRDSLPVSSSVNVSISQLIPETSMQYSAVVKWASETGKCLILRTACR